MAWLGVDWYGLVYKEGFSGSETPVSVVSETPKPPFPFSETPVSEVSVSSETPVSALLDFGGLPPLFLWGRLW